MGRAASSAPLLALVACGRIGFSARIDGDPDGGGDDDAIADGPVDHFTHVIAYSDHTCAVHRDRMFCWGRNDLGQIGDGFTTDRPLPTKVALPEGTPARLATGERHTCAIAADRLYCWGEDFAPLPDVVALPAGKPTDVAAGRRFTCTIIDGTLYCAGANGSGQLGDGTMMSRAAMMPIASAETFVAVDAGDDHACGLATAGARCWGHNDDGVLGTGSTSPDSSPMPVAVLQPVTTIPRIAGWHACSLEGTRAVCWGRNNEGALGDGTMTSTPTPQEVPGLAAVSFIATGGGPTDLDATCAIADGDVYCFGMGLDGRLGNGSADLSLVPLRVAGVPAPASQVALGYGHTCALLVDGTLWCWGRGDRGQLGDGRAMGSFAPVRVTPPI